VSVRFPDATLISPGLPVESLPARPQADRISKGRISSRTPPTSLPAAVFSAANQSAETAPVVNRLVEGLTIWRRLDRK